VQLRISADASGYDTRTPQQLLGLLVALSLAPHEHSEHTRVLHKLAECIVRKPQDSSAPGPSGVASVNAAAAAASPAPNDCSPLSSGAHTMRKPCDTEAEAEAERSIGLGPSQAAARVTGWQKLPERVMIMAQQEPAARMRFSPAELQQRLLAEVDLLEEISTYHQQVPYPALPRHCVCKKRFYEWNG
jgi:hypothetical protein